MLGYSAGREGKEPFSFTSINSVPLGHSTATQGVVPYFQKYCSKVRETSEHMPKISLPARHDLSREAIILSGSIGQLCLGVLVFRRGENRSTRRKTPWSKGENQPQIQPTHGFDAGI